MSYTIDASVFVAATRQMELHHADSLAFLDSLRQQTPAIFCPALVLTETVAAIARTTADAALVEQASTLIETLPGIKLIALEVTMARRAAQLAALHRLRGADAVYVAVAAEFGATLVTWDTEMVQRGASVVTVMTPADAVAGMGTTPQT